MQDPLDSVLGEVEEQDPLDKILGGGGVSSPVTPPKTEPKKEPEISDLGSRFYNSAVAAGSNILGNVATGLDKLDNWAASLTPYGKHDKFFGDVAAKLKSFEDSSRNKIAVNPADTKTEKVVEWIGDATPTFAAGFGLGKVFTAAASPLTQKILGKVAANISGRFAPQIATAVATLPGEMAGNLAVTAVTNPENLTTKEGLLTDVGFSVFGSALNGAISGTKNLAALQAQQAALANVPIKQVPIDAQNQIFNSAMEAATTSVANIRTATKALNRTLPVGGKLDPEIRKGLVAVHKTLKSLQVDGVSVERLAKLQAAQQNTVQAIDGFMNNATGLSSQQVTNLGQIYNNINGIALPQYNWSAAVPSVSAVQRLQDADAQALMVEGVVPGTAESFIAAKRPEAKSAFTELQQFTNKLVSQSQNYKNIFKIIDEKTGSNLYERAARLSGLNGRVYLNLEVAPMQFDEATKEWKQAMVDGAPVLSLNDVLKISGSDDLSIAKVGGYVMAKQILDGNLDVTGLTKEWATNEIDRITRETPNIIQAGNELFRRNKHLAEYMRTAFGDKTVDEWIKKDYAAMNRAFEKGGEPYGFTKGRRGGGQMVFNPIAQHITNTGIAIAATEKTRLWQDMYELWLKDAKAVEGMYTAHSVDDATFQKTLSQIKAANPGVGEIAARKMANILSGMDTNKANKSVTFVHQGKNVTLKFSDEFNELFNGFEGPTELGWFGKGIQKFESVPRTIFSIINDITGVGPARDLAETYLNDPNIPKNPIYALPTLIRDFARGFNEVRTEGDMFKKVAASGGLIGGRYVSPEKGIETSYDFVKRRAAGEGDGVIKWLERTSALLSQASRMGTAIRAFEAGKNADEAAALFRSVIADPQQVGSKMQAMAQITAFSNMGIQSLKRTQEQLFKDKATSIATMTKGLAGIGAPAAALWYWNKNDEEIQNLRKSKGGEQYFYMRPTDGAPVLKFPKPYLYGQIFGTGMEAMLDAINEKSPESADRYAKGVLAQMSFNVIPLTVQSFAQNLSGMQWMGLGEDAIPMGGATSNQMPEDRRYLNTSTTARKLGEITGMPAGAFDNLIRTFATNEPYKFFNLVDRVATGRTEANTEDLPFIGKFTASDKRSNTYYINRMYNKLNESEDVVKSFQDAESKGDAARLNKIASQHLETLKQGLVYSEGIQGMREIRGLINMINENTLLSPEERREKLDDLYKSMNDYAKKFVESVEGSKK